MTTLKHISTRNEALPTVSIVTVTYNANALVENTLDNIRKQDYPNKEIIVIDGNSTDGTTDIIKSCAARGSVTKWISENDNGIYDAMNKGVNMATGEWIIFMNAGDYFASDNVLSQIFCQDFSCLCPLFRFRNRYICGFDFAEFFENASEVLSFVGG